MIMMDKYGNTHSMDSSDGEWDGSDEPPLALESDPEVLFGRIEVLEAEAATSARLLLIYADERSALTEEVAALKAELFGG